MVESGSSYDAGVTLIVTDVFSMLAVDGRCLGGFRLDVGIVL